MLDLKLAVPWQGLDVAVVAVGIDVGTMTGWSMRFGHNLRCDGNIISAIQ